ncbi:MAG: hypothetical protein M3139_16310 [Bacteroidota bacterium]|nr:hypothetical protein [Bacteroidota bacterium]
MGFKEKLKHWIVPPGFYNLKRRIDQRYKNEEILDKVPVSLPNSGNGLFNFKDKYNGKRCFILATGPSIATQDLSLLAGECCIAVSMFHLHKEICKIKPIWHVLAPVHPPFKLDTVKTILETCYDQYKGLKEINFMLGHRDYAYSYKNYIKNETNRFKSEFENRIHYVDYNKSDAITEQNYDSTKIWDLEQKPFGMRTVIFPAIQLAYYLGFKEIILLGCDHDYLLDLTKVESQHFYPERDGFSDKETFTSANLEEWFYTYYVLWKEYRLIQNYMNDQNVKIINATNGGMLDVFPRVKFESFFYRL